MTNAKKAFKKGQNVIHFADWDRQGTWVFIRAIVKSCGSVRMTLENAETGVMMGNHFQPDAETTLSRTWQGETIIQNRSHFTLADMTDDEAHAICLKHGALTIADEQTHFNGCVERHADNPSYCAVIENKRAALHEPRSLKR